MLVGAIVMAAMRGLLSSPLLSPAAALASSCMQKNSRRRPFCILHTPALVTYCAPTTTPPRRAGRPGRASLRSSLISHHDCLVWCLPSLSPPPPPSDSFNSIQFNLIPAFIRQATGMACHRTMYHPPSHTRWVVQTRVVVTDPSINPNANVL